MYRAILRNLIPVLTLLLGVQIAAAVMLGMRKDRLTPAANESALISGDMSAIDSIVIDGPVGVDNAEGTRASPATVTLARQGSDWLLRGDNDVPANGTQVGALMEKLRHLRRGQAIGSTGEAQRHFKVAGDEYARRVVLRSAGKEVATLWVGDSTALHQTGVRVGSDAAVYLMDLSPWELPTASADWLDRGLLKVDSTSLARLQVTQGDSETTLQRRLPAPAEGPSGTGPSSSPKAQTGAMTTASSPNPAPATGLPAPGVPGPWEASGLPPGTALNSAGVTALVNAVAALRYDDILGSKEDPAWRQQSPALRLVITEGKSTPVTWTLSKASTGSDYVLKSSNKPWYFKVGEATARSLLEAATPARLTAGSPASPGVTGPPTERTASPAGKAKAG